MNNKKSKPLNNSLIHNIVFIAIFVLIAVSALNLLNKAIFNKANEVSKIISSENHIPKPEGDNKYAKQDKAPAEPLVETKQEPYDFNNVQCNDMKNQVGNIYRLAHVIEEYKINNPSYQLESFNIISKQNVSNEVPFLNDKKFKSVTNAVACHTYKVQVQGATKYTISLGNQTKDSEVENRVIETSHIVYDSSAPEDVDALNHLVENKLIN